MGHLNNARYIDYMLNAREDHLRDAYQISLSSFAKKGVGWVVTSHEIQYIRPAVYNERVCIVSILIETKECSITVEMVMYDEKQQQIKAVLWTTFTHISIKTGKRAAHEPEFQHFLESVTINMNSGAGLKVRVAELIAGLKTPAGQ